MNGKKKSRSKKARKEKPSLASATRAEQESAEKTPKKDTAPTAEKPQPTQQSKKTEPISRQEYNRLRDATARTNNRISIVEKTLEERLLPLMQSINAKVNPHPQVQPAGDPASPNAAVTPTQAAPGLPGLSGLSGLPGAGGDVGIKDVLPIIKVAAEKLLGGDQPQQSAGFGFEESLMKGFQEMYIKSFTGFIKHQDNLRQIGEHVVSEMAKGKIRFEAEQ